MPVWRNTYQCRVVTVRKRRLPRPNTTIQVQNNAAPTPAWQHLWGLLSSPFQPPTQLSRRGVWAPALGGVLGVAGVLAALVIYLALRTGAESHKYEFHYGLIIHRQQPSTVGRPNHGTTKSSIDHRTCPWATDVQSARSPGRCGGCGRRRRRYRR